MTLQGILIRCVPKSSQKDIFAHCKVWIDDVLFCDYTEYKSWHELRNILIFAVPNKTITSESSVKIELDKNINFTYHLSLKNE